MTTESSGFEGVWTEVEVLFPGMEFTQQLKSNAMATGKLLAEPENHETLSLVILGALDAADTDQEILALRDVLMSSMVMAGLASWRSTRNPFNIKRGAIMSADETRVYKIHRHRKPIT